MIKLLLLALLAAGLYFGLEQQKKTDDIVDAIDAISEMKQQALELKGKAEEWSEEVIELKNKAMNINKDAAARLEAAKNKIDELNGE